MREFTRIILASYHGKWDMPKQPGSVLSDENFEAILHFQLAPWHMGLSSGYVAARNLVRSWLGNISTQRCTQSLNGLSFIHSLTHSVTDSHPHTNACGGTVWKDYDGLRKIAVSRCSHHASPHTYWSPAGAQAWQSPRASSQTILSGWPPPRWATVSRVQHKVGHTLLQKT